MGITIRKKQKSDWKQGRSVEIETTADIWVDEYLEYATTEALLEEIAERGDLDLDTEDLKDINLINLFIKQHNLSVTDGIIVTEFLKKFIR